MTKKKKQSTPLPQSNPNGSTSTNRATPVPEQTIDEIEEDLVTPDPSIVHPSAGAIPRKDAELN